METGKRSGLRGVWPVVRRELREGARRPFNHWLRVGSALAGMVLLYANLSLMGGNVPKASVGIILFSSLHTLLLVLICCIVPTMTADCIAREKREGTLGLLFLTGLTPMGIVVGKSLVQCLRAFTLWVAVLPILTIPFLTGGVSWNATFYAVTMEFCAAVLCLAAGLLASTMAKARAMAFALALMFAAGFMVIFGQITPFHFFTPTYFAPRIFPSSARNAPMGVFNSGYVPMGGWGPRSITFRPVRQLNGTTTIIRTRDPRTVLGPISGASPIRPPLLYGESVIAALLMFLLVITIAARRIEQSWQDKPPSVKRDSLVRRYCTPLLQAQFARRMRRALDRNPIAWLQEHSWRARIIKWGLCLVFVILECLLMDGSGMWQVVNSQAVLVVVLACVFTFAGVNSFLEEKKSGALELILITPLSVNQIIFGRVLGLWKQFLPAAFVLAGFYAAATTFNKEFGFYDRPGQFFTPFWFVLNGYLSLPVFATYFALRVKNMIFGAILTWIALVLAPLMGFGALDQMYWRLHLETSPGSIFVGATLGNAAFALLVCFLLRHSLSRRIYSF